MDVLRCCQYNSPVPSSLGSVSTSLRGIGGPWGWWWGWWARWWGDIMPAQEMSADTLSPGGSPEGAWYIEPMAGCRLGWGELTQSCIELGNTAVIPGMWQVIRGTGNVKLTWRHHSAAQHVKAHFMFHLKGRVWRCCFKKYLVYVMKGQSKEAVATIVLWSIMKHLAGYCWW